MIKINFDEIISYNFPINKLLKISITSKKNEYTFLSYLNDNNKLLCLNKNQIEYEIGKKNNLNVFKQYFKDYSVLIYDCSIEDLNNIQNDENPNENDFNRLKEIKDIIEQISKNRAISNSNIYFFGNYENSFFSILFGFLLRNSKVIVENPIFNLKENSTFKKNMSSLINDSYVLFNSMNSLVEFENSKKEYSENCKENHINEIKGDLNRLNENQEKLIKLFNKNYVLKNELLLEKNRLSLTIENKEKDLIKTQQENEKLKQEINKQTKHREQLTNRVKEIFNAENKLREEISLLKNQNYSLKQEIIKQQQKNAFLNDEISKIKDDEMNRLKIIQTGIHNE